MKENETSEISLKMLSPSTTGRYVAYFNFKLPNGEVVGERLWVDIVVDAINDDFNVLKESKTFSGLCNSCKRV